MYRERAQPEHRKHFGLLEKKQDWSKRSKYYKQKQNQLNLLRKKADLKNEEEFYFRMQNAEQKQGTVHIKQKDQNAISYKKNKKGYESSLYKKFFEEEEQDPNPIGSRKKNKDLETIVKTQNQGVVRLKKMQLQKKINKLKSELQFIGQTDDMRHSWDIAEDEEQFQDLLQRRSKKDEDVLFKESTLKTQRVCLKFC